MKKRNILAIDLGASGGKSVLGKYDGNKLTLFETNRFPNYSLNSDGLLRWNIVSLYAQVLESIKITYCQNENIESVGVDSWGLDFGLIDEYGFLISNPIHYISNLTLNILPFISKIISPKKLFKQTGINQSRMKTLAQLVALKNTYPEHLLRTKHILFIADLIIYFLTGQMKTESTIASTSQLINIETGKWDEEIINSIGININLFNNLIEGGQQELPLRSIVKSEINKPLKVSLTYSHDTACAFIAAPIPVKNKTVILSCGSRAILGIETDKAIIDTKAYKYGFSNEKGPEGTTRFVKSINGLWGYKELLDEFKIENEYSTYELCDKKAMQVNEFNFFVDLDSQLIIKEGRMTQKIIEFCRLTGQRLPITKAEFLRGILESLAMGCNQMLSQIEEITETTYENLFVVGGGGKSKTLMQFISNATGKIVKVFPYEASIVGNLFGQLKTLGDCSNRWEFREILGHSYDAEIYEPQQSNEWKGGYFIYERIYHKTQNI